MTKKGQLQFLSFGAFATCCLACSMLGGCRNPGEEGQNQTHTQTTPDNPHQVRQGNVPTPPTADQVSPSSPTAVLGGTSTTQPAMHGNPPSPPPPQR